MSGFTMDSVFWLALLQIIGINIVLSGDNAVVIALAARSLPPKQQKQAVLLGIGAALPQKIALPCWSGRSERAASAITTALSPDRMMLVKMIEPRASQKAAEVNSMDVSLEGRA